MIADFFRREFGNKRIAILGFGLEGRSSYKLMRRYFPEKKIIICDQKDELPDSMSLSDRHISWFLGKDHLAGLEEADIIMKSPGISYMALHGIPQEKFTTQTAIFLELFRKQVVGITGTKGKSTTSSLLHHILVTAGKPALLTGNIGTPCFDLLDKITDDSIIVFELSSHQLEKTMVSPGIAMLLNIFMEHLDHYTSYDAYKEAKMNIALWQQAGDIFIYSSTNQEVISQLDTLKTAAVKLPVGGFTEAGSGAWFDGTDLLFSYLGRQRRYVDICTKRLLPGAHNLVNISAAVSAAVLLGVSDEKIIESVETFRGLPHRMEYIGSFSGVHYYNDSIATIPEAVVEALKSLPDTSVLILGGKDRGLDYGALMRFIAESPVEVILFTGETAQQMHQLSRVISGFEEKHCVLAISFEEAVLQACRLAPAGSTVLLSPAAASYDAFKDFKARGERFKELVMKYWSGSVTE